MKIFLMIFLLFFGSSSYALTGAAKLACEALLCLSSNVRPGSCTPSLSRYFNIKHYKPWKTFDLRFDFLSLCPTANSGSSMTSLVRAISRGAGHCDAAGLNRSLKMTLGSTKRKYYRISNVLPDYCSIYYGHGYTVLKKPTYVGNPYKKWRRFPAGYWVD